MKGIIVDYLKAMRLKVSHEYIEKQLLSHPDYPSILSVSDVLEQLGMSVQVGRISKEQVLKFSYPYLLYTKAHQSGFLLIKDEKLLLTHLEKLNIGEGVILKAVLNEDMTNLDHEEALQKENLKNWSKIVALLSISSLMLLSVMSALSFQNSVFLITVFAGLALSYVLIARDFGVKNATVEAFCGAEADNYCDKVLTSEYSKILGNISFSDLVLTFFTAQAIIVGFIIPFSGLSTDWWSVMGVLAASSIPAILYSVYLQWVKIQAWCSICLSIVGLLILQLGFFSYTFYNGLFTIAYPDNAVIAATIFLFTGIGSAIFWLKELVKGKEQAIKAETSSNRVKYNPKTFAQYLSEQRKVNIKPFENEITIGNPEAPIHILVVSNLYCKPCKAMHEKLDKLFKIWPDKLQISFRFLPRNKKHREDIEPRKILLSHLIKNINKTKSSSIKAQRTIQDWFERESTNSFINKYRTGLEQSDELHKFISLNDSWIKETGISKTPSIFMNGFEFPQQYSIGDIIAMCAGLADYFQNERELDGIGNKDTGKEIV